MGDLNYVYAVARIRVKEKSLLSNADVAQMCGMKDADAVLGYLSEKGWGSAGERQSADQMLAAEEAKAAAVSFSQFNPAPVMISTLTCSRLRMSAAFRS